MSAGLPEETEVDEREARYMNRARRGLYPG